METPLTDGLPTSATQVPRSDVAFYCVCDAKHYLGLVALINSLRLVGHLEPIYFVDAGLEPAQRESIAHEVSFIEPPDGVPLIFLRPVGPMVCPADVAVMLDADIIVVRRLTELIEAARGGKAIAFVDNTPHDTRYFPEWQAALDVGEVHRHRYYNAGQLIVPRAIGDSLLPAWRDALARIDVERTWHRNGRLDDPFYFGDQDVLNALATSFIDPADILSLENRLAPHPPFPGLELVDRERLVCRYADGVQPFLLHHTLGKPWLQATRKSIYSTLLTRLLLGHDVAIRLEPSLIPHRLRSGRLATADLVRADRQARVVAQSRRRLGRFGIRTRIARLLEKRQHSAS